jgi:hypothetical protein
MRPEREVEYDPYADVRKGGDDYGDEEMDEEIMYEIDMPEGDMYEEELTDEEINQMLGEMDNEEVMNDAVRASGMDKMQPKEGRSISELEDMFEDMLKREREG